jgi:hypothetical protein
MQNRRFGLAAVDSSVRSPTRTSSDVRSPTRTSTTADTKGNVTVTGGAGAGATRVLINQPPAESSTSSILLVAGILALVWLL